MVPMKSSTVFLQAGRDKPVRQRHPWVFSGAIGHVEGHPASGDLVEVVAESGEWLARGYYNDRSQIVVRILTWERDARPEEAGFWRARLAAAAERRRTVDANPTPGPSPEGRGEPDSPLPRREGGQGVRSAAWGRARPDLDANPTPSPSPEGRGEPDSPFPAREGGQGVRSAAGGPQALSSDTDAYRLVYAESDGLPGLIVDRYGGWLVVQFLTAGVEARRELLLGLLQEVFEPSGIVDRCEASV